MVSQIPSYWGSTGTVAMEDELTVDLKLTNSGSTNGKLGFDTSYEQ